jgi:NitT/TauT family transport system permease protein
MQQERERAAPRITAPRRPVRSIRLPGGIPLEIGRACLSLVVCAAVVYAIWEIASLSGSLSPIVLPAPIDVFRAFGPELSNGDLQTNTLVTLREALGGLFLAAAIAAVVGYLVAHLRPLELLVTPFVAASQGVPVVAIAPIIILLLGSGTWPKVAISASVAVFPLLITTVTGLRSIQREYRDVALVFGASPLQMLWYVELPFASPFLLSGLKLGFTLSITGAVVGEFVAADAGLGFMVNTAINTFEVATRYVALITLAGLSIGMFALATLLERIVHQWIDI